MNQKINQLTDDIILIFSSLSSIVNNNENLKFKEEWLNTLQGFKDELEPYQEVIDDAFNRNIKNLDNRLDENM